GFTADTAAAVEVNNAVLSRKQRRHGTDLDTRCIGAMIAAHHRKQPSRVGKGSLLDVFDPGAIYADRYLMLGLARNGTRMAADTLTVIDYEAEIHRWAWNKEEVYRIGQKLA